MAALTAFAQKSSNTQVPNRSASTQILQKFSRYHHYTMEQGLSSNWVTSVAQDEDGFMWFGTAEGLNRFDGEHFSSFFSPAAGSSREGKGLPSDHINKLLALPGHRLLIGSEKGLSVLHTRSLEFEMVALPARAQPFKEDIMIHNLYQAKDGQIWVGAGAGVFLLNDQLQVRQSYIMPLETEESIVYTAVKEFLELPEGTIAVKYSNIVSRTLYSWRVVDFEQQKTVALSQLLPECGVLDTAERLNCIVSDRHNSLWYTTTNTQGPTALFRFDWADRKVIDLLPNTAYLSKQPHLGQYNSPCLLPDSLLFLQRYFGPPLIYNLREGTTTNLPVWKTSLPDGKAILNFVDRDGNLWLCPRSEGIYFLTLKNLPARDMPALNATHKKRMEKSNVSEEWFPFYGVEFAGKWVVSSSNGGLYSMDSDNQGAVGPVLDNPFQAYAYVTDFAPDRSDTLWINTLGGLYWYNPQKNTNGPLKARFLGLDSLDSRFLYRDHYGLIWGRVRNNGVCCFDTRSRQFTQFASKGENAPFPLISATTCTEGPDGDMWFSYGQEEKYVVRYRRATGNFEKIAPLCPAGTSCTKAFELRADPRGNLWLYTDQGWFIMDTKTLQVQSFGKDNGLITNDPAGMCLDRDGNAWFATPFGLSRYDASSRQLRTFYQTDGLLSSSILNVELIDTARNILFVSTDRGMCLFEPDKVGAAAPAPPTYITGLLVSDKPVSLPASAMLALPYNQNDLRIEFTGVNFINGPGNRYQYSMEPEGSAAEWKEAGTDNFANFLNVAPGHYTFRARTANSDGVWGVEEATLSIVIYPPWWQTWTFQLSLLSLLGGLIWVFYNRQIVRTEHREQEKAQVRQQMADLEMKALRSQMNPHFVFNALNSVQNFILKNDTREASRFLTKFARLMRLILENSESPMVPLAREIELLRYYTELEQLRFNFRFSFDFQVDSTLNAESIAIPGMLIQPHIENAIWHGLMHKTEAGHLFVRFLKVDDKTLVCEIEDDGVGRARAAEIEKDRPKNHRSTGLANIRNRLELLNAQLTEDIRLDFVDLYDEQGLARGTKVMVKMPVAGV